MTKAKGNASTHWLNPTVLGIGLASMLSDWSHETATTILPAFLATLGVAAGWVGLIEGVSDGLSSLGKLASGHWTDRLARRKPVMVVGYLVTALGTASFGLATAAWQVLLARATAWLGRGVRTPVRKAMLAAAVTRETYGRAFGFERMMDSVGAVAGPASAYFLLLAFHHDYSKIFFCTLVPGVAAVVGLVFLVKERERLKIKSVSFGEGLRALPGRYRRFALAVGLFGLGDFSPTLLLLLATQKLTPLMGSAKAASAAVVLYIMHNAIYAGFSFVTGWLADRVAKPRLLAAGYGLAGAMALVIMLAPLGFGMLAVVFVLGGLHMGVVETAEDSLCAEMADEAQHGMAFGVLATANGAGDFLSSVIVGALWSAFGTTVAFGYSFVLFVAGVLLIGRLNRPPQN